MSKNEKIHIIGPTSLSGSINISGSKNAALPILAATILTDKSILSNVPILKDVSMMLEIIETFGMRVHFNNQEHIEIICDVLESVEAPYSLLSKMRASFLVLGPLLARKGHARVALPGGCAIGSRPVDLHLKVMRAMGADIELENGVVVAYAPKGLFGVEYRFDSISVGATENAIMAAVLASGTTVLHHVAREPEIIALADALNSAGAKITGHGTDTIVIEGVTSLNTMNYKIIPDRIEAGTFLIAAVMSQGDITVNNVDPAHLDSLLCILRSMGAKIDVFADSVRVAMTHRPHAFELITEVYPGFSTDLQAQMVALACVCDGVSTIRETVFENRMMHVPELVRMGADIKLMGNAAIVTGVNLLQGAEVCATDLRASVALLLAGVVARGKTEISSVYHIDRGYVFVEERFRSLGANVIRLSIN